MESQNQSRNHKRANNWIIILALLGLNFVFIGGGYYKITQSQQSSLSKTNDLNRLSNLIDKIQPEIVDADHYITDFELNNKLDQLAIFNAKTLSIKESLFEIKSLMRSDEDTILIGNIEKMLTKYQDDFRTITTVSIKLGLTEESGVLSQFTNRMKDISNIVIKAKDEKLTEKYLVLRSLQESYLKDTVTAPEQVIVAQKNFLDRVNRSSADYANTSKMMVQTISLMQSFELLKNSFEEKRALLKQVEADRLELQAFSKQLLEINHKYKNEDEQLVMQTEQQNFILLLVAITLVIVSVVIALLLLNRDLNTYDELPKSAR